MRPWLKEAREAEGLTLQQLSQRVDVSPQALSYYETGERTPTVRVAIVLGEILHFSWTRFYEEPKSA